MTDTKTKYIVQSSMFKGKKVLNGEVIGYTYEITFNKSLGHTGRFTGIEDGLNNYVIKERKTDLLSALKQTWLYFIRYIKN